jgi:hypothetical protein
MARTLIILIGVLLAQSCFCQEDTTLCLEPDTNAEFKYENCGETFECVEQFVEQNAIWPSQDDVIITVYCECIVERDGSLSQLKVARGYDKNFNDASLDIIRKMPNWIPAKNEGIVVRTKIRIPVKWQM